MVFDQDVLTRIVNVHFGEGLAVEFGNKDQDAPKLEPGKSAARPALREK